MQILDRFMAYVGDFEKTYVDNDWGRIAAYFAADAVYEVRGMPLFPMVGRGRQGVVETLEKAIDDFDRRCASRRLTLTAPPSVEGDTVTIHWQGIYEVDGGDPLNISGREDATYNEAGEIKALIDTYDEAAAVAYQEWMARHHELLR